MTITSKLAAPSAGGIVAACVCVEQVQGRSWGEKSIKYRAQATWVTAGIQLFCKCIDLKRSAIRTVSVRFEALIERIAVIFNAMFNARDGKDWGPF